MSRRLAGVALADTPHRLDVPGVVLDERVRALVAEREAAAEARGREAGRLEAAAAAAAAAERVTAGVARALQDARQQWERVDLDRRDAMVDVARQLAAAVLVREPGPDGRVVLDRVSAATAALDHGPFRILLAAADHAVVASHADALPAGCELALDESLAPGEVLVIGPWSRVDLTAEALLDLAAEAIQEVAT